MRIDGPPKPKGECAHCGSPRLRRQYRINANDGSVPVWQFRCYDCERSSLGALVMLPPDATTIGALDEEHRRRQRDYSRRKYGYQDSPSRGTAYLKSDRLDIRIRIIKGQRKGVSCLPGERTVLKYATPELRLAAQRKARREYQRRKRQQDRDAARVPMSKHAIRYETEEERVAARRSAKREFMRRKRSEEKDVA